MPRRAEPTRRRIIDAAYEVFYEGGFARASVDSIAQAAGVTKRTLYYHFDSKDALIAAVLDAQHELVLSRIQRWAKRASGDPARMVGILFEEFAAWAKKPGWQGSGFTRAVMELADMPGHPARAGRSPSQGCYRRLARRAIRRAGNPGLAEASAPGHAADRGMPLARAHSRRHKLR